MPFATNYRKCGIFAAIAADINFLDLLPVAMAQSSQMGGHTKKSSHSCKKYSSY